MLRRRLYSVLAAATLISFAVAGCSSAPEAKKLDPAKSPLQVYMSALYPTSGQDDFEEQQKKTETLVAACMADEGFDYVPVDQSQYSTGSVDDYEERDTEKWVTEHGYGMVQTEEEIAEQTKQSEEFVDPNQEYVAALSPGEQTAYYEVLYGVTPAEEDLNEDGSYEYKWEEAGCQGSAQHEVSGDDPSAAEENKPLFDAMNALYEGLQKSPTIKKLDAAWSSCMADAGYSTYKAKQEAQQSMNDELNALYEAGGENGADEAAMATLREKEVKVALADFTCSEKVDYTDASIAAQFELEEQFIADHKSELDSLISDAEQGK